MQERVRQWVTVTIRLASRLAGLAPGEGIEWGLGYYWFTDAWVFTNMYISALLCINSLVYEL